jgi:S-(hydroxymethyl)glutathione dehydrogenase/alcohol dehydrogenase
MEASTLPSAALKTAGTLPRTTRAAILVELHRELVLDEVELPGELGYGQVLVHVRFSGVCGSQLGEIDGVKGEDKHLPHLLGHEGAGIVLATGPGVARVRRGDAVVLHWMKGRGIDAAPAAYRWQGQRLNAGCVTTFNEYSVVSENRLTPIPPAFPLEWAALFGCAVTTGLGVVTNNAALKIGQSLVVLGAGGVGLNVVQGAAMVSAHPIVAVDLYDSKLELARRLGATHAINGRTADIRSEVLRIVGGSADIVVDNTGQPAMIELAYELTSPRGRTILVGVPRQGANISIHSLPLHFGKVLTGSHGGEACPSEDIPRYVRLVEAGKLRLDALITETAGLDEINEVIVRMRQGKIAGRAMVDLRERGKSRPCV